MHGMLASEVVRRSVLVVDDEESIHALAAFVLGEEFDLHHAYNGWQTREILEREAIDLVFLDLNLPDCTGLELLRELPTSRRTLVLVLTAHDAPDIRFEAGRSGADGFYFKGGETYRRLGDIVRKALSSPVSAGCSLRDRFETMSDQRSELLKHSRCAAVQSRLEVLRSRAPSARLAAFAAEAGVEAAPWARLLHEARGRSGVPLHRIAAGSRAAAGILAAVVELAGTGATVLVERAGELPQEVMVELLAREPASGGDPIAVVFVLGADAAGRWASGPVDAACRTGGIPIAMTLPPLRERLEDLPGLVDLGLARHARALGRPVPVLGERAQAVLGIYHWPGNDLELDRVTRKLVALYGGEEVDRDRLPSELLEGALVEPAVRAGRRAGEPLYRSAVAEAARGVVRRAVDLCGGDHDAAARLLEVSVSTVKSRLREAKPG
jgi:two-component system, NtrC family, response regulator PilR